MNANEIRSIEERLTVSRYSLPVSQEHVEAVIQRAKEQRARVIAQMLASIPERLARLARAIRGIAADCTAARIRHT